MYSTEDNAKLPAEEFLLIEDGSNFGWPYCYYNQMKEKKLLAPEYGGDRQKVGRCAEMDDPIMGFPGHYAPNDVLFYTTDQFPEKYRNGAFIAFHGSWNRAPEEQEGYNVVFVPFDGEKPSGDWEVFANGFAGVEEIQSPGDAEYRPTGLAVGPEGSLYVSESTSGKIWKIMYTGE
jgi:glucose/arabinose dehydrogenase